MKIICLLKEIIYLQIAETERGKGNILTCVGFSFTIIWWNNSVFLFDSRIRNANEYYDTNRKPVLLKFCLINRLKKQLR